MEGYLFSDIFFVEAIPSEQAFEKVTRIICKSDHFNVYMEIDLNTDIFDIRKGDKLTVNLSRRIEDDEYSMPIEGDMHRRSILDEHDYVMQGKIFRLEIKGHNETALYASFGGLLMKMQGSQATFSGIHQGMDIVILMKKL
eukprot:TRINITY_DN82265_c0_g1_i1.p1 TRINITY_DN82265_c0_g1~~TRINITY_DN82265_c0_g1_i1.p1  ORF type:complete len:141 (-),score=38.29 TRINITY_DN82265_c0_g1_i1:143-565(-)